MRVEALKVPRLGWEQDSSVLLILGGQWVFAAPGESRSRRRWGLSRLRKDKGSSQPNLSDSVQEDLGHQYVRSESGKRPAAGQAPPPPVTTEQSWLSGDGPP